MRKAIVPMIVLWAIARFVAGAFKLLLGLHGEPARILVAGVLVIAALDAVCHPSLGTISDAIGGPADPVSLAVVPSGNVTPTSWADALLADLGAPATADNQRAIVAWERAEGGHWQNSARFNPLNSTQLEPGSQPMNSVGVQAYMNWAQGMAATVTTLRNGRYGGVLEALGTGNCAPCVAAAVGASPWGTGVFPT